MAKLIRVLPVEKSSTRPYDPDKVTDIARRSSALVKSLSIVQVYTETHKMILRKKTYDGCFIKELFIFSQLALKTLSSCLDNLLYFGLSRVHALPCS
jgi:hypothetical protein